MSEEMNHAEGYLPAERIKNLLSQGYTHVAMHKDSHDILPLKPDHVTKDGTAAMLCGVRITGKDYVILSLLPIKGG